MKYFIGLKIAKSSAGIVLSQRHYALQLLEDAGFLASKPVVVPTDPKLHLNSTDGDLLSDPSQFRRLIGRLVYLTFLDSISHLLFINSISFYPSHEFPTYR